MKPPRSPPRRARPRPPGHRRCPRADGPRIAQGERGGGDEGFTPRYRGGAFRAARRPTAEIAERSGESRIESLAQPVGRGIAAGTPQGGDAIRAGHAEAAATATAAHIAACVSDTALLRERVSRRCGSRRGAAAVLAAGERAETHLDPVGQTGRDPYAGPG